MKKQCGNCRFGVFQIDKATGGTKWDGICAAHLAGKSNEQLKAEGRRTLILKVQQHFNCSNNKFEAL